jgi:hypothetical protein
MVLRRFVGAHEKKLGWSTVFRASPSSGRMRRTSAGVIWPDVTERWPLTPVTASLFEVRL